MIASRREFLAAAAGAAGMVHLGLPAAGRSPLSARRRPARADTYFEWKEVGPAEFKGLARAAIGEGGNSLVLVGKEQSLLIDCKLPAFGAVLLREARALGPDRVIVVNTHHHADHTGGNHAMKNRAEKIIAHVKCKGRVESGGNTDRYKQMAQSAARDLATSDKPRASEVLKDAEDLAARIDSMTPADWAPTDAITQNTELELAGERVLLRFVGPGHTDNDIFIVIPRLNIVHTGDLVFNRLHPVIDRPGGATTKGWLASLKAIIALCDGQTVVVPGHGDITNVDGVKAQATYFEAVREAVGKELDKGTDRAGVEKIELERYKDYAGAPRRTAVLGAVYDELVEDRKGASK